MPQGPPPVTHFLTKSPSTEGSTTLSNSATSYRLRVKTLDPMGTVHIQTKTGTPFFWYCAGQQTQGLTNIKPSVLLQSCTPTM